MAVYRKGVIRRICNLSADVNDQVGDKSQLLVAPAPVLIEE